MFVLIINMSMTNITKLPWETLQYIDEFNAETVTSTEINEKYIKDSEDSSTKWRLNFINKTICTYNLCKAIKMWKSSLGKHTPNKATTLPGVPFIVFKNQKIPSWYNDSYHEQSVRKHKLLFSDNTSTEIYQGYQNRWIDLLQFRVCIGQTNIARKFKNSEVVTILNDKCNCLKPVWDKKHKQFRLCQRKVLDVHLASDAITKQMLCGQHGKMLCGRTSLAKRQSVAI